MKVIEGRNVNELFVEGVEELHRFGQHDSSRNGDVIVAPYPVMSVYQQPTERVLFDSHRDANPFFHLMESLWMLGGRDDEKMLNCYVRDFGARFAEFHGEPGAHIHGAYGHRWRNALGFDQLDVVVDRLRRDPRDRQCVIQMWDARWGCYGGHYGEGPEDVGENDLKGNWLDRPCNTHVYLRMRDVGASKDTDDRDYVLDLTVCCRSNDVVWGAYGANAVHFSMLQEYLAGRIGVGVGRMYQLSNNYHGYVDSLAKLSSDPEDDPYENAEVYSIPIGATWVEWDRDLTSFLDWHDATWSHDAHESQSLPMLSNSWFNHVAAPVAMTYRLWRSGQRDASRGQALKIDAPDWRLACANWIDRRL